MILYPGGGWWRLISLVPVVALYALTTPVNPSWRRLGHAAKANGAFVHDDLQLIESEQAYRGVYYCGEANICPGDVVFKIPLDSLCILSDDDDRWAFELATKLSERMLREDPSKDSSNDVDVHWFSLFPKPDELSATLPIHWDEILLESVSCLAMQAAVDAAYFARGVNNDMLSYCLDLVQTRVCRMNGDTRCLAPLFDCLNHHDEHPNCEFTCDGTHLIVSSIAEIRNSDELSIHYGDASTKPPWRCLVSYGFVPPLGNEEQVEVVLNDRRFVIHETEVPEDLVAMYSSGDEVLLDDVAAFAISDALEDYRQNKVSRFIRLTESYEPMNENAAASKRLALELLNRNEYVVRLCATNLRQWASRQQETDAAS